MGYYGNTSDLYGIGGGVIGSAVRSVPLDVGRG